MLIKDAQTATVEVVDIHGDGSSTVTEEHYDTDAADIERLFAGAKRKFQGRTGGQVLGPPGHRPRRRPVRREDPHHRPGDGFAGRGPGGDDRPRVAAGHQRRLVPGLGTHGFHVEGPLLS